MMYKVATYSGHGAPCPASRFIPMAKHENETAYISMDNTRISENTFSVPLGFWGYLLTIMYANTGCPKSKVTISNCYGFTIYKHNFIIFILLELQ